MKNAGYACGIFGKWHLGYEPKFNPVDHGWGEFFGYLGGNVPNAPAKDSRAIRSPTRHVHP